MGTAPRLFVTDALAPEAGLTLAPDQARYVAAVMRRGPGDAVRLFNGRDGEWLAVIEAATKKAVSLRVSERLREQAGVPDLHLLFAPVKRARTDFIAEKATELGVAAIRPVFTERSIAERVRTDRLESTAREAAEQTERLDLPAIHEPEKLDAVLDGWEPDRALIYCDEAGDDPDAVWGGDEGRAAPALEVLRAALFYPSVKDPTPTLPQGGGSSGGALRSDDRWKGETLTSDDVRDGAPSPLGEGRGGGRPEPSAQALARGRRMRASPTLGETKLWEILKGLKRPGAHFRRQAVIGPYIADFACLSARLIVEADGGGHGGAGDLQRDSWLRERGYRVVRVWNNEVLENPVGVADQIEEVLVEQMEAHPTPTLPSRGGSSVGAPRFTKLAVLIGPEGGFSPGERDRLRAHECVIPIGLGPRILRADTACVAALTLVQAVWGDWARALQLAHSDASA